MTGTPIEQNKRKVISHEEFLKKKLQQKRQNEKCVIKLQVVNPIDRQNFTAEEIVQKLIERDNLITGAFFHGKCQSLLTAVIAQVFTSLVDYDAMVNEFYYYLMRPNKEQEDAAILNSFKFESSLYSWLKVVAIRFFIRKRKEIEEEMERLVSITTEEDFDDEDEFIIQPWESSSTELMDKQEAHEAVESYLQLMLEGKTGKSRTAAQKYVTVIRRLMLDEEDPKDVAAAMGIKVDNLYVVKKRAMSALTDVIFKENPEKQ